MSKGTMVINAIIKVPGCFNRCLNGLHWVGLAYPYFINFKPNKGSYGIKLNKWTQKFTHPILKPKPELLGNDSIRPPTCEASLSNHQIQNHLTAIPNLLSTGISFHNSNLRIQKQPCVDSITESQLLNLIIIKHNYRSNRVFLRVFKYYVSKKKKKEFIVLIFVWKMKVYGETIYTQLDSTCEHKNHYFEFKIYLWKSTILTNNINIQNFIELQEPLL